MCRGLTDKPYWARGTASSARFVVLKRGQSVARSAAAGGDGNALFTAGLSAPNRRREEDRESTGPNAMK